MGEIGGTIATRGSSVDDADAAAVLMGSAVDGDADAACKERVGVAAAVGDRLVGLSGGSADGVTSDDEDEVLVGLTGARAVELTEADADATCAGGCEGINWRAMQCSSWPSTTETTHEHAQQNSHQ